MDVREAAAKAKQYLQEISEDTELVHVAVEEVEYKEHQDRWNITIGFFRPWSQPGRIRSAMGETRETPGVRTYKTIVVDGKRERVVSVKERVISKESG